MHLETWKEKPCLPVEAFSASLSWDSRAREALPTLASGGEGGNCTAYRSAVTELIGSCGCDLIPNQHLGIQRWKGMISFGNLVDEKVKDWWEVDVRLNLTSDF